MRAPHEATARVVELAGEPLVQKLYAAFHAFNAEHFGGELAAPLVLLTNTSARSLGDYCARDAHGLQSRIRINPKALKGGERMALDVLLHEMVHAYQHEVLGDLENGYRGHGPIFAETCNDIGQKLGLGEVGVKGRDGLPDCKYWPMILRPSGYYDQDFKKPKNPNEKRGGGEGEGESDEGESDPARACETRAHALVDELSALVPTVIKQGDRSVELLRDRLADLLAHLDGAATSEAAE